jgi:DtxR family Mn-dependent transcriptional regulator
MPGLSSAEENYLKAVYKVSERLSGSANTNALAEELQTTAASVTDMLKRLSAKGLLLYESRRGCTLSAEGRLEAMQLVRKHRLWETFLVDKLQFSWDEVHDIAEQLEHIQSEMLVDRLDAFLGRPRFDPHGDPIPDAQGRLAERRQLPLAQLQLAQKAVIVGVIDHQSSFLQYLDRTGLTLGVQVEVVECFQYDQSMRLRLPGGQELIVSHKVSQQLLVAG